MISFLVALAVLVIGYITYGHLTEKVFGPDDRKTPAIEINDGVSYPIGIAFAAMLFVTYVIASARYIKTNEL